MRLALLLIFSVYSVYFILRSAGSAVWLRLLLMLALLAPGSVDSSLAAQPQPPNIVLIMADDMGWSDAGCYGGEIATPHIDSLSKDGLRFTQFYNNAVCGPTRASLLTGLYPQQSDHPGNNWNAPKNFDKCVLIPEVLQKNGYHTMMVGKWQGRDLAVHRGFDHFFGPNCQAKISFYHEVQKNPFSLNADPWTFPDKGFFMTDAFVDHAVDFLEEHVSSSKPAAAANSTTAVAAERLTNTEAKRRDEAEPAKQDKEPKNQRTRKPFFLYVAYIAPHWPLHTREFDIAPYRKTYREHGWEHWRSERFKKMKAAGLLPASLTEPPLHPGTPAWADDKSKDWEAERMAAFAGQVTCLDRGIGRVLDTLKKHDLEENTLVLFLSDNGASDNGGRGPANNGFGFSPKTPNNTWRLDGVPIRPGSGPSNMPGPHNTFAAAGPDWASVSNMPFRGAKSTAFEGGIRTPLVARWPAVIKNKNSLTTQPGHIIDLMATCLDVAGIPYPEEFDGRSPLPLEGKSLLPVFRGQDREAHEALCWYVPKGKAIRMGDHKLVAVPANKPWELFDLSKDPSELNDLAAQQPARVTEMNARFEQWRKHVGAR